MTEVRILSAAQVEELLDPDQLRQALIEAMIGLSAGRADVPPRVGAEAANNGKLLAMPGYLEGVGLAAKLVSLFPENTDAPSHQGVIALLDHETGTPVAVMDAEVITTARTSMVAAIATDRLARPEAEVLTIVGGGAQAVGHAEAFAAVRPWREVRTVNRSQPAAVVVAGAAREAGAAKAVTYDEGPDGLAAALDGADVVALCTHADRAVIDPAMIGPGVHVSSVGSQAELPPALADGPNLVVVEWRGAVAEAPPAGAAELQHIDPSAVVELGALLAGDAAGRASADQITVYKSTGHAVQDVAAAALINRAAVAAGVGTVVEL